MGVVTMQGNNEGTEFHFDAGAGVEGASWGAGMGEGITSDKKPGRNLSIRSCVAAQSDFCRSSR